MLHLGNALICKKTFYKLPFKLFLAKHLFQVYVSFTMNTANQNLNLQDNEKDWKAIAWEYAQAIIIALVLALFIRTFVVQAFKIPSGSMIHTLLIGDHILVNKFIYGIKNPLTRSTLIDVGQPEHGDIVVFIFPLDRKKDFIKRVIGTAGDTVQVINKKVFVNGKPIKEAEGVQHTKAEIIPGNIQPRDNFGPVTVPEGHIFVMGDNRDESFDSRYWGFVPLKDVKGKAFMIYWSWNSEKFMPRLDRIGDILH
jgi:signal peptidase I